MPLLKALKPFFAYPNGYTRADYVEGQEIDASDDYAKSLLDAELAVLIEGKKEETTHTCPDGFKTLAELKEAVAAPNLKVVAELVESLGHVLESQKGVTLIPAGVYEAAVAKAALKEEPKKEETTPAAGDQAAKTE